MKLIGNDGRPVWICNFCGVSSVAGLYFVVGITDDRPAICSKCIDQSVKILPKCEGKRFATPQPTTTDADAMAQQLQRGLDRATGQLATDPESRIAKLVSTNRTQALAELATPQPTTEPAAAGV